MHAHGKEKINTEKYGCPSETVQLRVRPIGNAREEEEAWLLRASP